MNIADLVLAAVPPVLIGAGAALFFFGWLLGGGQSRLFYTAVLVTALAAAGSQVALGAGFARSGGIRTPTATLYSWSPVGEAGFGVQLAFRADLLAYLFALPLSLLTLLSVFYLLMRRPRTETQDGIVPGRLYGLIFVAEGAGLAAFYSADLVLTYFWLEAAGLTLYLLSGPGVRGAGSRLSSYRVLGIYFFAGQAILAPLLVMISRNGGRSGYTEFIPAVLDSTLVLFIVAGCLVKAAQFPFQAWLGGFEDLPAGVYAGLMAGFLFPFAVYFPIRLQSLVGDRFDLLAACAPLLLVVGALTVLWATVAALRLNDSGRWSSKIGLLAAAQFGMVVVALGLNDLPAAFQQLVALMIGAPVLFWCADQLQIENAPPPNPDNRANPDPVRRPPLYRAMLSGLYVVAALNFAGLPLSPAYTARWQTLNGLMTSGNRFLAGLVVGGLVLGWLALLQGLILFLNGPRRTADGPGQEWYWTLVSPLALALLSIGLGFYPALAAGWMNSAIGRTRPAGETVAGNAALGWLGLLVIGWLGAGLGVFWGVQRARVVAPYNGGLYLGAQVADRPAYARTGRSKMALKVVEPEKVLPEGFDDEFFSGAYKHKSPLNQTVRRPALEPRLAPEDYFGPLTGRLKEAYKIFDTGYIGGFFSRILLGFLAYTRRLFEWSVERFYPALAAFILLVMVILLTR